MDYKKRESSAKKGQKMPGMRNVALDSALWWYSSLLLLASAVVLGTSGRYDLSKRLQNRLVKKGAVIPDAVCFCHSGASPTATDV